MPPRFTPRPHLLTPLAAPLLGLLLNLFALAPQAHANSLVADFQAAIAHDPLFNSQRMQTRNLRIDAKIAAAAYYPRAGITLSQDATDNSTRRTARITQPLLSADRWLTRQEAPPRETLADLLDTQAHIELASRVFDAVRQLALSREKLALSQSNLQALQAQSQSAQLAYQVGQGTITDVLDTQLRVSQLRAQIVRHQADHDNARRHYASITGQLPAANAYPLSPRQLDALQVPPLEQSTTQTLQNNPVLRAEQQNTQLKQIGARRARAQLTPSLNANWQRSQTKNGTTEQNGLVISFDLPLSYGSAYAFEAADNQLIAQQEKQRATQENLLLDVQRLHAHALSAQQEVQLTREAIEAAELSLSANRQSFEGGVRSQLDVLNALQAVYTARETHLSAQLTLAHSLLSLALLTAPDIPPLLTHLQTHLFTP